MKGHETGRIDVGTRKSARMAESVDALVSNTNDSNVVPVRSRLRVHSKEIII